MQTQVKPLDTTIEIVTPENIAFQYRVAGPFLRLPAYLIDKVICAIILSALAITLLLTLGMVHLGGLGVGMILIAEFLLSWFYGGLFEAWWNGQTPGKRLLGIRVLTTEGQPINGMQAILRNVLRVVDAQPMVFYLVGLLAASRGDRFQRLGDVVAGTMVVLEPKRWILGLKKITDSTVLRLAEQIPPGFQVSRSTARALAAYVQRRAYFSPQRRWEIARHLGDLLREELELPPATDRDRLLCAVYHHVFLAEQSRKAAGESPFAASGTPPPADAKDPLQTFLAGIR